MSEGLAHYTFTFFLNLPTIYLEVYTIYQQVQQVQVSQQGSNTDATCVKYPDTHYIHYTYIYLTHLELPAMCQDCLDGWLELQRDDKRQSSPGNLAMVMHIATAEFSCSGLSYLMVIRQKDG